MAQTGSLVTEEMRAEIGVEGPPRSFVVEAGHIRHFALAIEDPNPLYTDESFARTTPYGGTIAPPTFFRAAGYALPAPIPSGASQEGRFQPQRRPAAGGPSGGGLGLDGGSEWEFYKPLRPGDVITVVSKLADIQERAGRAGGMIIRRTEAVYTNQFGEMVAKGWSTSITQFRLPRQA